MSPEQPQVDDLPVGTQVGPYVVVDHLGQGGMGQVFLGNDVRLHRKVALKRLLAAKSTTDRERARVLHEARAAAQINHPNVATIHDVIEHESRAFIVMEYVEGEHLGKLMRRGRLSVDRVIAIGRQLAAALSAAHARGVIHRDLKPANVQVTTGGDVKVLDFGVAASTAAFTTVSGDDRRDEKAPQPGTRGYMSPEQMMSRQVDERSDVFSLGIILFEMATGEHAFPATDFLGILAEMSHPVRRADTVDPEVPRELADVIAKTLAIDIRRRYQTAAELDAALETVQRGRLPAPPITRRQVLERSAAGVALIGLLVFAGVLWSRSHRDVAKSIAVLPLKNLSAGAESDYFSEGITDLLATSLAKVRALHVISRTSTDGFKDASLDSSEIAKRLNAEAVLQGTVQLDEDRVRIALRLLAAAGGPPLWTNTLERSRGELAILQADVAREVARSLKVPISADEEQSLSEKRHVNPDAQDAYLRGRSLQNRTSREGAEKSAYYFEEAIRIDPDYAPAYAALATSYIQMNTFGVMTTAETMGRARAAVDRALALDDRIPEVYAVLGDLYFLHQWQWSEAEKAYRRAIDLNPSYAYAHAEYAWFLSSRGRLDAALQMMYRAEEADPLSLLMKSNVAGVLYYAHRFDDAISKCQQIIRIDPTFGIGHRRLMQLYAEKRKFTEALAEGKLVLQISGSDPGSLADLARVHALAGNTAEAERMLGVLLNGPTTIGRVVSPDRLAFVQAALGHRDQAFELLQRAINERAPNVPWLGVDPHYDTLHDDARFAGLLKQLK